jgi:hypothetical protein
MMDILCENSKEYPKSVTELFRLEEKKICARRLLLHKQNSYIYLKKAVNVQNINSRLLELRDKLKNRGWGPLRWNKMFVRLCYRGQEWYWLGLFCIHIYFSK